MSEAISYYARTKEEKSEDSGIESGNSLENTGKDHCLAFGMRFLHFFLFQDLTVKLKAAQNIPVRRIKTIEMCRLEQGWLRERRTCLFVVCDYRSYES
jgi:hypothetical protein